jgi:AcrR family transcriptional regulator
VTLTGEDFRAKIVEEAIGIVYRQGPRRITMRSLAEKLGYSPGTIYLHFRSKQELLKEIALHGFDALGDAVAPAHALEDPFEAIAETARRYIDFGLEHHELYRLMFHDISLVGQLSAADAARVARTWALGRVLYERGIASGAFRKGDPEVEANIGWAWVHGFVELAASGRLPAGGGLPKQLWAVRDAMIEARLRALRP